MISLKSEITKKVLNYFFLNSKESLYINELVRKFEVDKRNLVKKIRELEEEGILMFTKKGNLKLYSINEKYPLYNEYKKIFLKTIGFENELKKLFTKISGIKNVFIYGSYIKNKMAAHSDIDILVVGEHNILELQKAINILQKQINREINVINMDEKEYLKRKKQKDPFIIEISKNSLTLI